MAYKPMVMDLLNVNEYIGKHKLKEVTSERILSYGKTINSDGLFSYEIFGKPGTKERSNNMAFINLNCKIITPFFFLSISKLSSKFLKLAQGTLFFKIVNGKLIESNDDEGSSGISFIYENFNLVKEELIKDTGSNKRKLILSFLSKVTKEDLFMDKWLIIPAALREINTLDLEAKGIINYEPINDLYLNLIKKAKAIQTSSIFNLVVNAIHLSIQSSVNDIYSLLINQKVAKKGGIIQQSALSKPISFSVGSVIANAKFTRNSYKEEDSNNIPFGYIGVPLTQLCDMFYPFVIARLKQVFSREEGMRSSFFSFYFKTFQ